MPPKRKIFQPTWRHHSPAIPVHLLTCLHTLSEPENHREKQQATRQTTRSTWVLSICLVQFINRLFVIQSCMHGSLTLHIQHGGVSLEPVYLVITSPFPANSLPLLLIASMSVLILIFPYLILNLIKNLFS